jgi:glucose/arabinose dehydrogenase
MAMEIIVGGVLWKIGSVRARSRTPGDSVSPVRSDGEARSQLGSGCRVLIKSLARLAASIATLGAGVAPAAAAPLADPIPAPIQGGMPVGLATVATGLAAPNWATFAPGFPDRLFVTDQNGILWAVDLTTGARTAFLDVSSRVVPTGERGLLGVAFHPAYQSNGLVYTYTSEAAAVPVDFPLPLGVTPDHVSVITEWLVSQPGDPAAVIDPTSGRTVLSIAQPQANHNGGALTFGPDDRLYVSLGDGGAGDDQGPGHSPQGNGQDPGNLLGAILRIDPDGADSANGQYGVPAENPFFPGGPGPFGGPNGCLDGLCDEIFAFGFRNPFRFSFDAATGDLYAADVGQLFVEEVDVVRRGGNYGWPVKEGAFCFDPNGTGPGFVTDNPDPACGRPDLGLIDPIAQYDHNEGSAIIGGFVYRGSSIPELRGRYIFGDLSRGRLFALERWDRLLDGQPGSGVIAELQDRPDLSFSLFGFGQDASGEIYVLGSLSGAGVVLKLVPAPPG